MACMWHCGSAPAKRWFRWSFFTPIGVLRRRRGVARRRRPVVAARRGGVNPDVHQADVPLEVPVPAVHPLAHGALVTLAVRVHHHVNLQAALLGEPGRTQMARVELLDRMPLEVPLQRPHLLEGHAALGTVAHVRPARVKLLVTVQGRLLEELAGAHAARVEHGAHVHQLVPDELGLAGELAVAKRAGVVLDARVLPQVVLLQVARVGEVAAADGTGVLLLVRVREPVRLHVARVHEVVPAHVALVPGAVVTSGLFRWTFPGTFGDPSAAARNIPASRGVSAAS